MKCLLRTLTALIISRCFVLQITSQDCLTERVRNNVFTNMYIYSQFHHEKFGGMFQVLLPFCIFNTFNVHMVHITRPYIQRIRKAPSCPPPPPPQRRRAVLVKRTLTFDAIVKCLVWCSMMSQTYIVCPTLQRYLH